MFVEREKPIGRIDDSRSQRPARTALVVATSLLSCTPPRAPNRQPSPDLNTANLSLRSQLSTLDCQTWFSANSRGMRTCEKCPGGRGILLRSSLTRTRPEKLCGRLGLAPNGGVPVARRRFAAGKRSSRARAASTPCGWHLTNDRRDGYHSSSAMQLRGAIFMQSG